MCTLPQRCVREFKADLDSLQNGSLTDDGWDAPYDRLALIILADQLPRWRPGTFGCIRREGALHR